MKLHMTLEPSDFADMLDLYLETNAARVTRASRNDVLDALVDAFPNGLTVGVLPIEKPAPVAVKESEPPPTPVKLAPEPDPVLDTFEDEEVSQPVAEPDENMDWDREIADLVEQSRKLQREG